MIAVEHVAWQVQDPAAVSEWYVKHLGFRVVRKERKPYGLSKTIVQYWRSFDHLERYARNREALHWPAWVEFNRRMKESRDDVGIWHETYKVRAGEYEALYSGMPPYGLGKAGVRAIVRVEIDSARQRIGMA